MTTSAICQHSATYLDMKKAPTRRAGACASVSYCLLFHRHGDAIQVKFFTLLSYFYLPFIPR